MVMLDRFLYSDVVFPFVSESLTDFGSVTAVYIITYHAEMFECSVEMTVRWEVISPGDQMSQN